MRYFLAGLIVLAAACAHQSTARERYEAGYRVGYDMMENGPARIAEADPFVVGAMQGIMRWGEDQMRKEQEVEIRAVIDEARAEREERVRRPMTPMHKIVDDAVRETDRQLKPLEDALSVPDDDLTP